MSARLFLAAAAALVVAAFAGRAFVLQRADAQLAENELLLAALAPLREETRERDLMREEIGDLLARKQIAETLDRHSSPAAEALAELSRLPRDIVLTRVEIDGMRLAATGSSRAGKPYYLEKMLQR